MSDDPDPVVLAFWLALPFAVGMVAHVVLAELGLVAWVWP